jgi:hypothetical protein
VETVFVTLMYCNSTMKSNLTHEWQHSRELAYITRVAVVLIRTSLCYRFHFQISPLFLNLSIWHCWYWIAESKIDILVDSTIMHSCQCPLLLTLAYVAHSFFYSHFCWPYLGKVGYFENKYLKMLKVIILSAT